MIQALNAMCRTLARLILGVIMLFGTSLQATSQETIDLDDFDKLEIQLLDHPARLEDWIKKNLPEIDRRKNPKTWVRGVFVYAWIHGFGDFNPPQDMQEALELALKLGLYVEWVEIRVGILRIGSDQQGAYDKTIAGYVKLVEDARALGNSQALAYALAGYASYLVSYRRLDPTMSLLKEAQDLLNQQQHPSLLVFDLVKNIMSLALSYQGQLDAALQIHQNAVEIYQKHGIRHTRALYLYNMGLTIFNKEAEQNGTSAEKYFTESLRLATEVDTRNFMGMSLYGLSKIKLREKKPDEARVFAQKSRALFKEQKFEDWVYALDKQLAETEVAAGRYAEALAHVPPAQSDKMLNDKKFKKSIDYIQYQAHLGLGDTAKALMYLQQHVEVFKDIALEQEKKEYNRAAVQLGLQIEAERNAALAKRNELQSDQIQLLQKFRLVSMVTLSLSLVVLVVLYIVRRQAREIQVSRKKMKEVLDNIDEGILTLDRDLKVLSGYSPYLDRIFSGLGSTLEGWPIHRLLYSDVDASECVMMAAALQACMGEDAINWELNASHLPTEIRRGDRLLQLHWQDLTNRQNVIHSFLVSIRDITEQRATENALKEQNERLHLLQQKLGEILAHDVAAIRNLLGKIHEEWVMMEAMLFQNSHISQAFQRLHGWKGAARTVGLMQLASHVHALESCLDLSTQSLKDRDQTHNVWLSLKIAFQDYESLMGNFTEGTRSHQPQNLFDFAALYTSEFESRLRTHGMGFQGLAIQDGVRCWRPEALQAIHEVLQHALSNALDHGFIRPGWKIPAWIRIEALLLGHEVVIHALDNGAGIDWATLRAKAQQLGLPTSAEGKPKELLFREGVSTADGTLATSGPGIGLSAVQSICKEWGGTVTLDDAPHHGTLLTLRLPADRALHEAYPKAA